MIDTDNYAASGIETFWFSGGEPHVKLPPLQDDHVHIYARIRTAQDAVMLLAVCSALDAAGIDRHIFMPYLPGARQDRVQNHGALTCEVYARMFAPAVTSLTACDVHSSAAVEYYERYLDSSFKTISYLPALAALTAGRQYDLILCPDHGAVERTRAAQKALKIPAIEYCEKSRDAQGRVTLQVPESVCDKDYERARILIADDICDGGATFIQIADQVQRRAYTVQLDLYVTHGIFSKGFDPFDPPENSAARSGQKFHNIMTTDSFFRLPKESPGRISLTSASLTNLYLESLTP